MKNKKDLIIISLILVWGLFLLPKLTLPYVADDEFGYWMSAAFFGGFDWKSISSNIAYYSYGYGIVLLPFIKTFHNPIICYQAAVFFNTIWMIGIYYVTKRIVKKFLQRSDGIATIIAICIITYSNILIQSKITWPELSGYFLLLVIMLLVCEITSEKTYVIQYVGLAFSLVCLYSMHQRYLGVMIAVIISLLIQFIAVPRQRKKIGIFACVFLAGLGLHSFLKAMYQNGIWSSNQISTNKNDYSNIFSNLHNCMNLKGVLGVILSGCGQIYYCSIAALGIPIFGALAVAGKLQKAVKKRTIQQVIRWLCLTLMGMGTFGISAIFFRAAYYQYNRADCLIYGRYVEGIIVILLILGIDKLYDDLRERKKSIVAVLSITLVFITVWGIGIAGYVSNYKVESYNMISSVSGGLYWQKERYLWYIPVGIYLAGTVLLEMYYKGKASLYTIKKIGMVGYFTIALLTTAKMLKEVVRVNEINNACIYLSEELAEDDYKQYNIYYLMEENGWKDRKKNNLQFLLKEKPIRCLDGEQIQEIFKDRNGLAVTSNDNEAVYYLLLKGYEIVFERGDVVALLPIENGNNKMNEVIAPSYMYGSDFEVAEEGVWTTDINGGYLCYGPYIGVPEGRYAVKIKLKYIEGNQSDIGYVVLRDGENIFDMQGIEKEDFMNGEYIMTLEAILPEGAENLEYSIYIKEGSVISTSPATILRECSMDSN